MLHTIIVVLFMFFSTQAFAGWIAYEAKIFQVASSLLPQVNSPSGSPDRFAVKVVGGTVSTCHGPWIVFEKSYFSGNPEAYQRAFSMALAAQASGATVKIHNLNSDSCNGATSIQIL